MRFMFIAATLALQACAMLPNHPDLEPADYSLPKVKLRAW